MCKGMMGKKLGMTGLFAPDGRLIPVTVIQAGPCVVTQVKTQATDGYNALQLGFDEVKARHVTKPRQGHFRKSGESCFRHVQEFPVDRPEDYAVGQQITLEIFAVGERVDVSGTTKGRGFAGVIKKEGFSGGRTTHGSKCHRIPGSIGSSAWPSRVFKGKGMPGHYGVERQTMQNIEIVDIRPEDHLLLVRGAVPGPASGLVAIKKPRILKKK
jgi:large subunit ribosomal protein L3